MAVTPSLASTLKNRKIGFDLEHHGDEVIITSNDDQTITLKIKIQTGRSDFKSLLLTAESQAQIERLLPAILKGLKQ